MLAEDREHAYSKVTVPQHHYLRVYVAQLRSKIEVDANNPALLITEPGIGYRLLLLEEQTP
ncbi:MAG: winged helix-turn-helix domain-containing protein [SAR324 cluster bacterium]|nr:winged helix-turn-helix domain-containing protein [SAR324 cluster bacterium]